MRNGESWLGFLVWQMLYTTKWLDLIALQRLNWIHQVATSTTKCSFQSYCSCKYMSKKQLYQILQQLLYLVSCQSMGCSLYLHLLSLLQTDSTNLNLPAHCDLLSSAFVIKLSDLISIIRYQCLSPKANNTSMSKTSNVLLVTSKILWFSYISELHITMDSSFVQKALNYFFNDMHLL